MKLLEFKIRSFRNYVAVQKNVQGWEISKELGLEIRKSGKLFSY